MRLTFATVLIILFPSYAWSYSVFSGDGMGEVIWGNAIDRGRGSISDLSIPKATAFELSFSSDFISSREGKNRRNDFAFNLPATRYYIPLPDEFGLDLGLRNFLNMDFNIQSPQDTIGAEAFTQYINGKGGVNIASLEVTKKIKNLSIKGGLSFLFGSFVEKWTTDFDEGEDIVDTLEMNFSGKGITFALSYRFEELTLALTYAFPVKVKGKNHNYSFPWVRELTALYKINDKLNILSGFWASPWGDFKVDGNSPTTKFLSSSKISFGMEYFKESTTLRCGFYHMSWYYGDIEENILSMGIGVPFKDGEVNFSLEFGRRSNPDIAEDVIRLCATFIGTEKW
jgi:hypothetical protein